MHTLSNKPFPKKELHRKRPQRTYGEDATEAAFLLGGIGTGNVSLGSRGNLRDWEIWGRPGKGNRLSHTFFAISARPARGKPVTRVLESRVQPPFAKSHGFGSDDAAGLPRLAASEMRGEYPFVWINFTDEILPVEVSLEAFTPFIPLDAGDSGIPAALLRYRVKNQSTQSVKVTIVGSVANPVGMGGYDVFRRMRLIAPQENTFRQEEGLSGIAFGANMTEYHLHTGTFALMTSETEITHKARWLDGTWCDGIHDFWDDLREDGLLEPESRIDAVGSALMAVVKKVQPAVGSLGIVRELAPGEERLFPFVLAWHFPNRLKDWNEDACACDEPGDCGCPVVRNYYATQFRDAWHAGSYLLENLERLESDTRLFHETFFASTLPDYVLDAISANITTIRSPTCFRIEDGSFLSYEGCHDRSGCCPGSCTHVWNYAQTVAFLFPELERTARRLEFALETDEKGAMPFRGFMSLGKPRSDFMPAIDGQCGTIVRLYREWKLCGDDSFLRDLWDGASRALDYAFSWDTNDDFVPDGMQHNTYDIEFYGPNPLGSVLFLAALEAGAQMAECLGDQDHAQKYRRALDQASGEVDKLLFNGEYYVQRLKNVDDYRYQHGEGVLSDQLLGQLLAHVVGLGYLLPQDHVRSALEAVWEHNFRRGFADYDNVQRTYALNDEAGLLMCSWPGESRRPRIPFPYSDEVWTGVEYHVAAHMIYEGLVDQGLTLVKAVRDRHDGYRRNPWNEVECGHHYARAMSSWALLTALSGFRFDNNQRTVSFDPVIWSDDFSCFWSSGTACGIYHQRRDKQGNMTRELKPLFGDTARVRLV